MGIAVEFQMGKYFAVLESKHDKARRHNCQSSTFDLSHLSASRQASYKLIILEILEFP